MAVFCGLLIHALPVFPAETRKWNSVQLVNCQGGTCQLSNYSNVKWLVVAFLGTECPLAKLYAGRLQRLSDEFADQGVTVLAINANDQDSLADMRSFVKDHNLTIPFLKDAHGIFTEEIGATRTPEVFLLDSDRMIRYQGRIDDQYNISEALHAPKREDLRIAIEELIADKPVSIPKTSSPGCLLGRRPLHSQAGAITYANQVSRIMQNRCIECHREGQIGPFSLTNYEDVAAWANMIDEVVQEGRMPPWHADPSVGQFKNDRHLSDEEKGTIRDWIRAGVPQGDLSDLPEPKKYVEGWQLPRQPDVVIPMRDRPYEVAAEGIIPYQYFIVDPGFKEDKFVSACEVVPGNRKVVHHILVFALPPGKKVLGVDDDGFLFAYVPGLGAQQLPPGMAKRIPAGSRLLFQVHYTSVGTEEQDLSSAGLLFTDPSLVTHEVYTSGATNKQFAIPPGAEAHPVESSSLPMPVDCELMFLDAHMHVRGKSFSYEARFPDGSRQMLLKLPNYDFHWQTNYELAQSIPLPKGTIIHCYATFDNSENNPSNPDPKSTVRWGDQTFEEMMIGYFTIAVSVTENRGGLNPFERQKIISKLEGMFVSKLDKNQDGCLVAQEVGAGLWLLAKSLTIDQDKNDELSKAELRSWLSQMENPLDLLDHPLVLKIPEMAELVERLKDSN